MPDEPRYESIGVDIGGTNLRAGRLGPDGRLVVVRRQRLNATDPGAVAEQLVALLGELGGPGRSGVGVGLAAQLEPVSGQVAVSPNLGWRDVPFAALLRQRLGVPVRLINDLNAITLAESRLGAARGVADVVCVFVGTGLGMGALAGGRLVEGADGLATELGHVRACAPDDGPRCGCGGRGCFEAFVSGAHLPERLLGKTAQGLPSPLVDEVRGDRSRLDAGRIDAAAQAGDPAARALWAETAQHLAHAFATALVSFNPRTLVLGGGVWSAAPELRRAALAALPRWVGEPYLQKLAIVEAALGDDAGVIGAALAMAEHRALATP